MAIHKCTKEWEISTINTTINLNQKFMEEKFDKLETDMKWWFNDIKQQLEKVVIEMRNWFVNLDWKYATKAVEKIVYWMVAIILTSFGTSLVYLVYHFSQWK